MTMKDRVEKAVELFKSGYNCSQSVVAAFADMYGFTQEQALRMSASFGGGIGRMRQTCGAACGMFLLAGLEKGAVDLRGTSYALSARPSRSMICGWNTLPTQAPAPAEQWRPAPKWWKRRGNMAVSGKTASQAGVVRGL